MGRRELKESNLAGLDNGASDAEDYYEFPTRIEVGGLMLWTNRAAEEQVSVSLFTYLFSTILAEFG